MRGDDCRRRSEDHSGEQLRDLPEDKKFPLARLRTYFRDYHLLLDEQAAEILAVTDAIAERARKTGNTTIRSIGDIARHQTIKDNDAEFVTPQDMLGELRADNLHMVESFRRAKDVADKAKDNATSGLIDAWTDEAERRAWFLFEISR